MYSLLLAIIYLAFISLGLPDSLLGSAWPTIHTQLGVPVSFAGIITIIIAGFQTISCLLSDRLTKKFGAGLVTSVSVMITAIALFGFSVSDAFWMLCAFAIPYGIGAGAVDAALNNYIALHYASRHMNWLHCFWGVGATIGPYVMGFSLLRGLGWHSGYRTVAIMQVVLTLILFASLPLWKTKKTISSETKVSVPALKLSEIINIKGVNFVLPAVFAYCALEVTAGLWASSFLALYRDVSPQTAARYAALFYLGITGGRFLCGVISNKIGNRNMIRIGLCIIGAGILAVWLPVTTNVLCLNGLVIIGLGCAPIYPAMMHQTPVNFGEENSQAVMGVQMASGSMGAILMPPLFGLIASKISIGFFPAFLLVFGLVFLFMTEKLNKISKIK